MHCPSPRVVMLGYVGLGCGGLGLILFCWGIGSIVSSALAVSKRSREGFVGQDGSKGEVKSLIFEKPFGPLIVLRATPSKDVNCTKVFEGLGKVYLSPTFNDTEVNSDWSCSDFEGVKEVEDKKCEMSFKNICDQGAEVGNCAYLQQVASVDYPTCKKKDCPYVFQVWPWNNELGNPSFNLAFQSEHNVAPVHRGNCIYASETMARFMDMFWANGPEPWTPDNKTERRLVWASLWLLAIGIGAGVASCCAGGGSPEQEEVGAELMS